MVIVGITHTAALIPATTVATMLNHILIAPGSIAFHTELTPLFQAYATDQIGL